MQKENEAAAQLSQVNFAICLQVFLYSLGQFCLLSNFMWAFRGSTFSHHEAKLAIIWSYLFQYSPLFSTISVKLLTDPSFTPATQFVGWSQVGGACFSGHFCLNHPSD